MEPNDKIPNAYNLSLTQITGAIDLYEKFKEKVKTEVLQELKHEYNFMRPLSQNDSLSASDIYKAENDMLYFVLVGTSIGVIFYILLRNNVFSFGAKSTY